MAACWLTVKDNNFASTFIVIAYVI